VQEWAGFNISEESWPGVFFFFFFFGAPCPAWPLRPSRGFWGWEIGGRTQAQPMPIPNSCWRCRCPKREDDKMDPLPRPGVHTGPALTDLAGKRISNPMSNEVQGRERALVGSTSRSKPPRHGFEWGTEGNLGRPKRAFPPLVKAPGQLRYHRATSVNSVTVRHPSRIPSCEAPPCSRTHPSSAPRRSSHEIPFPLLEAAFDAKIPLTRWLCVRARSAPGGSRIQAKTAAVFANARTASGMSLFRVRNRQLKDGAVEMFSQDPSS